MSNSYHSVRGILAFFFSVKAMALWTIEHRMFAYDSFVKNNEVQREFRH